MLRKLQTRRGGFTLVEIMIVVAIIALLAAIAVPNFLRARKRSQATQVLEDLRLIDSAIDQYAIEYNKTVPVGCGKKLRLHDHRMARPPEGVFQIGKIEPELAHDALYGRSANPVVIGKGDTLSDA